MRDASVPGGIAGSGVEVLDVILHPSEPSQAVWQTKMLAQNGESALIDKRKMLGLRFPFGAGELAASPNVKERILQTG